MGEDRTLTTSHHHKSAHSLSDQGVAAMSHLMDTHVLWIHRHEIQMSLLHSLVDVSKL